MSSIPVGFADGVDNEGSGEERCFNAGRKCVADGTEISVETEDWINGHGCKAYAKVFGDEIKIKVDAKRSNYPLSSINWVSAYNARATSYEIKCDVEIVANGINVVYWVLDNDYKWGIRSSNSVNW